MRKRAGNLLIIFGTVFVLIALALVMGNRLMAQRAEKASLEVLAELKTEVEQNEMFYIPETEQKPGFEGNDGDDTAMDPSMDTITIDGEEYIGTLEIPRFGLELPIMAEWSYTGLQTAPGSFYGSVWTDDMVICAHNYSRHFGNLKDLDAGDEVIFTDVNGSVFKYAVLEVNTLQPTAVEEMISDGGWDLTLFTCTLGGAARVTVRCERIGLREPFYEAEKWP